MCVIDVGELPAGGGDGVTQFLDHVTQLAHMVGPAWAFLIVVTICLLMPRIGVVPQLAALVAADRADKRKRTVEYQRLMAKYHGRSAPSVTPQPSSPPVLSGGRKKK